MHSNQSQEENKWSYATMFIHTKAGRLEGVELTVRLHNERPKYTLKRGHTTHATTRPGAASTQQQHTLVAIAFMLGRGSSEAPA
jgi:hypothetical protein